MLLIMRYSKYFNVVNPLGSIKFYVVNNMFFVLVVGLQLNPPLLSLLQAKCSALHPVSERGDTSLVQLLLEYKAHTDFKNQVSKHKLGGSSTLF